MSLPNLSSLAHAPPRATGAVLTVEEVQEDPKKSDYASANTDNEEEVLECNLSGERFFASSDPPDLVVAIRLDDCGHVFHGSYLCTKVFGAKRSADYPDGVEGFWDWERGDWRGSVPPLCDYCKRPFAFSNIRELIWKMDNCYPKPIMDGFYPRDDDEMNELETKYLTLRSKYTAKQVQQERQREYQARVGIGVAEYGLEWNEAHQWAEDFQNPLSDEAVAAAQAYAARHDSSAAAALRPLSVQDVQMEVLPAECVAPLEVDAADMDADANRTHVYNMARYVEACKLQDRAEDERDARTAARRAEETIHLWNTEAGARLWWDTAERTIRRFFNQLSDDRLEGTSYAEADMRSRLYLPKRNYTLSYLADFCPKFSGYLFMDPDEYGFEDQDDRWNKFYTLVMKTWVPYLFGAHKAFFAPNEEAKNVMFLARYVADLGLSSLVLNRVKKRYVGDYCAAWFLPHPSCWISTPVHAAGNHVDALCPPVLADKLIDRERSLGLFMWSWNRDPNMPEEIDPQEQLDKLLGNPLMRAVPEKDFPNPQKTIFQLEYDYMPEGSMYRSRRCHVHVGVALETPVCAAGVVYLRQVRSADGGPCRAGHTLYKGPRLLVTLSVPHRTDQTTMAWDVKEFLEGHKNYDRAATERRYGLKDLQSRTHEHDEYRMRTCSREFIDDASLDDDRVYVLSCRLKGLRYEIGNDESQRSDAPPITVPIETYLRNGIAALLRKHEPGGRIARAFGMGPRMEWVGERLPAVRSNKQGVLGELLLNDVRPAQTLGQRLRQLYATRSYAIKGVVKGRTVVMRDRLRYKLVDEENREHVDITDPSQTEPLGVAHRNRERHPNVMACAELVLENTQRGTPWNP